MKHFLSIVLLLISLCLQGQKIERIIYRGDRVNAYPTDSITMVDVKLIPSLPDGKYYGFYKGDTAFLRVVIEYVNRKIEGDVVEYYYASFDTTEITGYKDGKKDGYWAVFEREDGQWVVLHEGIYEQGKKIGFQYSYHGNIGDRKVYNKEFYKDGKEVYNIWYGRDSTFYVNDTGYVYEFDGAKNLIGTGKSYKGERFGYWKRYNSVWDIWSQGEYELWNWSIDSFPDSRQVGMWEDYYSNGQLSRRYLFDREISKGGIATVIEQYDINGNLLDSMNFVNGVGLYKEFYSSGMLKREEYYSNPDNLEYEKYYSNSDGHAVLTEYPTDSTKVRTCYYPNGQVESIENYKAVFWYNFPHEPKYVADYARCGKQQYFRVDGTIEKEEFITECYIEE